MAHTVEEAIALIRKHENPSKQIIKAREYSELLKALINGKEYKELLLQIEGIEGGERAKVRKKFSRSIRDLCVRLLRPIDQVFAATGGTKIYSGINESIREDVLLKISDIRGGYSIEGFCKEFYFNQLHTDPNGLMMYEYKDSEIYPTIKSIGSIRAYKPDGRKVKWVIFEPVTISNDLKIIRFVDELFDYSFKVDGDLLSIIEDKSFAHPFGEVPALINSPKYSIEDEIYLSPVDEIVELMSEYLRDQSVKTLYKFLHGFPIFWKYIIECRECHGTGLINGKECPTCQGHGYIKRKDVSDTVHLTVPEGNETKLAPDIAGYIAPELTTWQKYTDELKDLENQMNDAIWGGHLETKDNETATGKFIDSQPKVDRLNWYSDVVEYTEWKFTEWLINFKDLLKKRNESVTTILYGRRYMIESPDKLMETYLSLKEKQVAITVLDRYMSEYLTTKYKNDPESLRVNLIKFHIEPWPHFTLDQVEKTFGKEAAMKKGYFGEWWYTKEENYILSQGEEKLKSEFEESFKNKSNEYNSSLQAIQAGTN